MKQLYKFLCAAFFIAVLIPPQDINAQCNCPNGDPLDSIVHVQTLAPTADFLNKIIFPKFNPATGTLSCVNISASVTTVASLGIRNLDSSARIYRFRYTQDVILDGPAGIFSSASINKIYGPATLDKYNTGVDSVFWGPDTTFKNQIMNETAGGSAVFLGASGTVSFDFLNTGSTTLLQGSNNYRASITTFALGTFRLAYYWCPNLILSSGMKNFSVVRNNREVSLKWITENEKISNKYKIEYSRNGKDFTVLDTRNAMMVGNARYEYHFIPPADEKGRVYFRIRQTNGQGKEYLTAIKTISFAENGTISTTLYPNPAKKTVMVQFDSPQSGSMEVDLINTLGQVMEKNKFTVSKASNLQVNFSRTHNKGAYWLRVQNLQTGEQSVTRLSIE